MAGTSMDSAINFHGLATDYDGTLARDGEVARSTVAALEKLSLSGRKLFLVSGRQLEDLIRIFPRHDLFDWIVAENGALIYSPRTRESQLLADPVPHQFPVALRARGINAAVGQAIVATWQPNECAVLETLRDLRLDRQIVFNKGAVMVLPTGVNKASGLAAALNQEQISCHNLVAVGDAENDLPMLSLAEVGAAVENALESVKQRADLVLPGDHGAGVEELIAKLLVDDLAEWISAVYKRGILLGRHRDDRNRTILLPSLGQSVLVAGPSGSGKSTVITGLLERIAEAGYQFCIFDPEGDYENFESAISLGNTHYVPNPEEVFSILRRMYNCVINLLAVSVDDRPQIASELLRKLHELRVSRGRPHWFVFDEAHHIFQADLPSADLLLSRPPRTSLLITVHPEHLRKEALEASDIVLAVGKDPHETLRSFCRRLGAGEPNLQPVTLERGEVLAWWRHRPDPPFIVAAEPGKTEHKRHLRKYADGDLGPGSFVFRGPAGHLNPAAQNLNTFVRMALGVDDETWCFHLQSGHISEWLRSVVKDEELADLVHEIEKNACSTKESRQRIAAAIEARYTLPE